MSTLEHVCFPFLPEIPLHAVEDQQSTGLQVGEMNDRETSCANDLRRPLAPGNKMNAGRKGHQHCSVAVTAGCLSSEAG